jgi:ADP-ribose pyrophosphatase YjhB (NUDIX family)
VKKLRDLLLGLIYRAAYKARSFVWEVQRPTLIGVRVLVVRNEHVLLIRHRAGKKPWALPGGGVERHERMAEAARREVYEETGAPVQIERLHGVFDSFHGEYSSYIAVFVAIPQGEPVPRTSIEIAELAYFPLRQLPIALDDGSRRRVEEYLAGMQGVSELW